MVHQVPSGFVSSSGKYFSTHSSGLGAAWPRPQIEASRMVAERIRTNAPNPAQGEAGARTRASAGTWREISEAVPPSFVGGGRAPRASVVVEGACLTRIIA